MMICSLSEDLWLAMCCRVVGGHPRRIVWDEGCVNGIVAPCHTLFPIKGVVGEILGEMTRPEASVVHANRRLGSSSR